MQKNALISVTDKSGIVEFARAMADAGFTLYSTGGTAGVLQEAGLAVESIAGLTGFPEIFSGRVKTLHPKVFGGILARQDLAQDQEEAQEHGIPFFDLVVVNLYRFAEAVADENIAVDEAIEQIDIGGVSLIRAAAKNFRYVTVVTSPEFYPEVIESVQQNDGNTTPELRQKLAAAAFAATATYDALISQYFARITPQPEGQPQQRVMVLDRVQSLRYGENPHQNAALYRDAAMLKRPALVDAEQMQGKALSYNNYMDADAAFQIARSFERPAAVIIKHANPCGAACADTLAEAYRDALATDSISAFGGIVSFNRSVDAAAAREVVRIFTEVVIAPDISDEALEIFATKKNLRVLKTAAFSAPVTIEPEYRCVDGGILVQDKDLQAEDDTTFEIVTRRKPSDEEWRGLLFAWTVVRWVKSNAVLFARGERTLGIGAGQMSRVDSSRIAVEKAHIAGLDLHGSVVASDAFFPFADGVITVAEAGATAIIQPGGSVRDEEVIEAANERNMTMLFTHRRHFRH